MSDAPQGQQVPQRTVARVQKGRWPGWIWAIPLAAVAIVVWLVVRALSTHGVAVTVTFANAPQVKADTTEVIDHGIVIGKVSKVSLSEDGSKAIVKLRIQDDEKKYLRSGTRFYLEGANFSLSDPASLKAILAGPTIRMVPGEGAATRSFAGIVGDAPEHLAVAIPYRIDFDGAVGDLKAGAPVMLRGFKVGEVTEAALRIDPNDGSIHTTTDVVLDPTRFHFQGVSARNGDWTAIMNAALKTLVAHQLRARLSQSPPLIGARQVQLELVPQAAAASLGVSAGMTEIPAAAGGGFDHLVEAAEQFPLQQIGDNVRDISAQIKTLSSSPKLKDSVAHLDDALKQLDQTVRAAGPKVAPTIQEVHDTVTSLKATAGELDQTVSAARAIVGDNPTAPDGSLEPTLLHVSEAARAIRELADYLDAHPESLIKGRAK